MIVSIFASMEVKKQHRSKYNFGSYKVGDVLTVEPMDVHSMLCSLASFNRRHNRKIEVVPSGELDENNKVKCLITKI